MTHATAREKLAAEVRAELARHRISVNRLPALLGNSQSYWARRCDGRIPFNIDELEHLSALFQVPITGFFATWATDPENMVGRPGSGVKTG